MKLLAFASICFVALLPTAIIGFFQQVEFARESVDQLALHLGTLVHQAREGTISPTLAVSTTQNNKLVLWSAFYRGDVPFARAGLTPGPQQQGRIRLIRINPDRPIAKQFPKPELTSLSGEGSEFRVFLTLSERNGLQERLEIGISYAALYSTAQDSLALSAVMFITAFLFLLGAAVFVDIYISRFTMRVIRAVRFRSEGADPDSFLSPTFGVLMEALERRDDQLIDTRDTLETIFNGMQIGVAMVSTELRIVLVNHYLTSLLTDAGASASEESLISEPCSIINLPGQTPSVEELCRRCLQSLSFEEQDIEFTIAGQKKYLVQEAYPLFGTERIPLAIIVQWRDVTSERLAQITVENFNRELQDKLDYQRAQLEETHQKLLQSGRLAAVGELAGGVAHEVNNPNGVILAGARYVLNRLQSEPTQPPEYVTKYLQRIVKQSERVADIVRALLTFSRRRPQEKSLLHVQDPIHDALELVGSRFAGANVQFEKDIPADLPFVEGNRNELAQVFLNLFNNAVDAMAGGGQIKVSADMATLESQPAVRVRVRDSGEGIPGDILDKVMEPFFTTKPVGKGTGLGLSISHGIIEEHSGTMRVRNHPEGGAEFEIVLPIVGGANGGKKD